MRKYFLLFCLLTFSLSAATPISAGEGIPLSLDSSSDVLVKTYGAVGDGLTNDRIAIKSAVAACGTGKKVVFESGKTYIYNNDSGGNYTTDVAIPAGCIIDLNGATIRNASTQPTSDSNYAHFLFLGDDYITIKNGTVEGPFLTFNTGSTGTTGPRNVTVERMTIKNISPSVAYPANWAIFSSFNAVNARILNNNFLNVAAGMSFFGPDSLLIEGNYADNVSADDFIKLDNPSEVAPSYPVGHGIVIRNNRGRQLYRMGVEWQGYFQRGGIVEGNYFYDWLPTKAPDAFGLSIVMNCDNTPTIVTNNILIGDGSTGNAYGIELGVTGGGGVYVQGNRVQRFQSGIVNQAAPDAHIIENYLYGNVRGLELANPPPYTHNGMIIERNQFIENKSYDIYFNNIWPNAVEINRNIFRRTIGLGGIWTSNDSGRVAFVHLNAAIGVQAAGTEVGDYIHGIRVVGNKFYQLGTSPARTVTYYAVRIRTTTAISGAMRNSRFEGNDFYNAASSAQGTAYYIVSSGICDLCEFSHNHVSNYVADIGGTALTSSTIVHDNNSVSVSTRDPYFSNAGFSVGSRSTRQAGYPEGQLTRNNSSSNSLTRATTSTLTNGNGAIVASKEAIDPATGYEYTWEFWNGIVGLPLSLSTNGTGAAVYASAHSNINHPGVVTIDTGIGNSGRAGFSNYLASVNFGGGPLTFQAIIKIPTLSDGTDIYKLKVGFIDTLSTEPANGAWFEYDQTASTNWRTCTSNSSLTTKNTQSTVVGTNWVKLKIVVNASATNVDYYVDDVLVGSHTGNIPTGLTGVGAWILKSAGTSSRVVHIDLFSLKQVFMSNR